MDDLHSVLRTIKGETGGHENKAGGPNPITVFREFLDHLERVSRQAPASRDGKRASGGARRGR